MIKNIIPFLLLAVNSFAQNIPANKQAVLSSVAKHEKELIGLSDEVWAHAEIAMKDMEEEAKRLSRLRDKVENAFLQLEEVVVNGDTEHRMPHVTNISFKHVEGEGLMMTFNQEIALSSGSACTSASLEPSYVLKALGLGDDLAHSSLRLSLGRFTTEDDVDYAIEKISKGVEHMRSISPIWEMYKEGIDLKSVKWTEH
jgi:cysteine desulfurase